MSTGTAATDPRMEALATAVRDRRERLGLRQADLAALAGCSQRFVHTVEAGKTTLRVDKLLDLLEVLGLDLAIVPGAGAFRAGDGDDDAPGLEADR